MAAPGAPAGADDPTPAPNHLLHLLLIPALLAQGPTPPPRDSTEQDQRTLVLPVVGYSEVTGLQYGATAFRSHRPDNPDARASTEAIYFARTAREHTKAYAQVERWSNDNALHWRARIDYRSYPLPYFGIGNATSDSVEEWYSGGVATAQLDAQQEIRPHLYVMAGWRLLHTSMREVEAGGALAGGTVPGSSGGTVSEIRSGIAWDSRDTPVAPRHGTWARVLLSAASDRWGSGFGYTRVTLDARRYHGLSRGFSMAAQLQIDAVRGSVPFDLLPMIGADSAMRGYDRGRYRDAAATTTQVELRSPFWQRAGFVVFAGAGTVADRLSGLASGSWYPTIGAGGRWLISPASRLALRLDLAFGRGSLGLNAGVGEAF